MSKRQEMIKRAAAKAYINKHANVKTLQLAGDKVRKMDFAGYENAMKVISVLGAALLINQFVKKFIEAGERLGSKMMKPSYYKKMMESNPRLLNESPEEVARLWETLYHNAPHLAKDPVAAGSFISQNIQAKSVDSFGGPPLDTYSTLNKIEGDAQNNRETKDPGIAGLLAGSTLFM